MQSQSQIQQERSNLTYRWSNLAKARFDQSNKSELLLRWPKSMKRVHKRKDPIKKAQQNLQCYIRTLTTLSNSCYSEYKLTISLDELKQSHLEMKYRLVFPRWELRSYCFLKLNTFMQAYKNIYLIFYHVHLSSHKFNVQK